MSNENLWGATIQVGDKFQREQMSPPPNEALFVEGQSETTPSIRVCNLLAGFLVMDSGGPQLGQVYS